MTDNVTDVPGRAWTHGANGLRSHAPQPSQVRWDDPEERGGSLSVCNECGYYVWFTTRWIEWPSRVSVETLREVAALTGEADDGK